MTRWRTLGQRNPLPSGAVTVGGGLLLAGVCTYVFLAIAGHALPPDRYSSFAGFWALLFVVGPGIFLPLEQELARAIAARRVRGDGGAPVIRRCAVLGGSFLALLLIGVLAAASPVDSRLLGGNPLLLVALLLGLTAYCAEHLARGTLSGNSRFRLYGMLLASEAVYRVVLCAVLAIARVRDPGMYAIALVVGSAAAVVTAVVGRSGLARPGSPSRSSEVTTALGSLLIASVATQFMINGGTVVVQLLATRSEQRAAGTFLNGRILAFVPLFLFQAVNAALLPRLSALHSRGARAEFARTLLRLLGFVAALGGAATVVAFLIGPPVLHLVFGPSFDLSRLDLALLAASCTALMAAQALAQSLIAVSGFRGVVLGWLTGVAAFFLAVGLVHPLLLRVEVGLLLGAAAAAAVLAALQPALRQPRRHQVAV